MPEIYPPVDLAAFANTIANNPQNVSTDWDRGCYDALKAHIKDHYSILQDDYDTPVFSTTGIGF